MKISFTHQMIGEVEFFYIEIQSVLEGGHVQTDEYEINVVDIKRDSTYTDWVDILMTPKEFARMMQEHTYLNFQMVHEVLKLHFNTRKLVVLSLTDSHVV